MHALPFALSFALVFAATALAHPLESRFGDTPEAPLKRVELTVTQGEVSPDGGAARKVFLINGKFPGPKLEIEEGDEVEVLVHSQVEKDITIHFHGIAQVGTPWSDGVPGVTQLPIRTNESFTYRWTAAEPGLYWYHGHFHDEIEDGLSGPIIIHPTPGRPAPFHLISDDENDVRALEKAHRETHVLQFRDWRHLTSEQLRSHWVESGIEPLCVESVIINGKGAIVCPDEETLATAAAIYKAGNYTARGCLSLELPILNPSAPSIPPSVDPIYFSDTCTPTGGEVELEVLVVDPENCWASLSLVNTGALYLLQISIDEHPFVFYAADGQYHEPVEVQSITVPVGERYQVFIKLDKPAGAYTIRAAIPDIAQTMSGFAILRYKADVEPVLSALPGYPPLPSSTPFISFAGTGSAAHPNATVMDPFSIVPYPPVAPPQGPADVTLRFNFGRPDATSWAFNASGLTGTDEEQPPYIWRTPQELRALADADPRIAWVSNNSIVDVIHVVPPPNPNHPVHKHFNKAFVLGAGIGEFPYESVAEAVAAQPDFLNLNNPPLRDGWNTLAAATEPSWLIVRYVAVNPGPNLLHCHIGQHLTVGMQVVLFEGMDVLPPLPPPYAAPVST